MPIKDVFLPLVGQPRAPVLAAIEKCVAVAADLGARITALALEDEVFVRPTLVLPTDPESAEPAGAREVGDMQQLLNAFTHAPRAPISAPKADRARCRQTRSRRSWPSMRVSAISRWSP